MYYEDVDVKGGETLSGLASAYCYKAGDWKKIWDDPRNAMLVNRRAQPERLEGGDIVNIPIPWHVISKTLAVEASGVGFSVKRDGENGTRLSWVQTVYRHNQPIGPNPSAFCVDACTPDDNLPFYWTDAEIKTDPTLRRTFIDHPNRKPPTVAKGTTKWRGIVSLAVVTGKRITVYDSWVWGFDMTPANVVTRIGPRAATSAEFAGHLNLLKMGKGTAKDTFGRQGWTFRAAP